MAVASDRPALMFRGLAPGIVALAQLRSGHMYARMFSNYLFLYIFLISTPQHICDTPVQRSHALSVPPALWRCRGRLVHTLVCWMR
jgi:hypothetical protein